MREARTLAVEWEGGFVTPTIVLRQTRISKSTSCLHGAHATVPGAPPQDKERKR